MEKVGHYIDLNRKYLSESERLLSRGDATQASEKLSGATAEIVKAVATGKDVELRSHRDLWKFAAKLAEELNDSEVVKLFSIASAIHQNFYEA